MIAVLFSGGIDSWACLLWAIDKFGKEKVLPIYIDFGQVYAAKEKQVVRALCDLLEVNPKFVSMEGLLIEDIENGHIPLRNTFLLMLVASIEKTEGVVFGMLRGESCEDKNPKYIRIMQQLFDSQFEESIYRTNARRFIVYTPFGRSTKTETVRWILNHSENAHTGLFSTVACFSAKQGPCGDCISCFNRWTAFENNGIRDVPEFETNHPFQYMTSQLVVKRDQDVNRLFLNLLWRKRYFLLDAYRALTAYSKRTMNTSYIRYLGETHGYYRSK